MKRYFLIALFSLVSTCALAENFNIRIDDGSDNNYPGSTAYPANPAPYQRHHHGMKPTWIIMLTGQSLPMNAVIGGGGGRAMLYICRAHYRGGLHPGKLHQGSCNFGWGGQEVVQNRYEVLVSDRQVNFVPGSYGSVPTNAIPGGYQQDGTLYICRANYQGGTHPGKLYRGNCNIGWGGQEIPVPNFEVLVQ